MGLRAVTFLAAALPCPSHSPQHSTWDWGGRRRAHCRSALPGALEEERIALTSPPSSPPNPTVDYQLLPGLTIIDPSETSLITRVARVKVRSGGVGCTGIRRLAGGTRSAPLREQLGPRVTEIRFLRATCVYTQASIHTSHVFFF